MLETTMCTQMTWEFPLYCKGVEDWFELLRSRLCCYLCSDLHVLFHRECHKLLWQSALTVVACCKNKWLNLKRPICVVSHMFTLITTVIMFQKKKYYFSTCFVKYSGTASLKFRTVVTISCVNDVRY